MQMFKVTFFASHRSLNHFAENLIQARTLGEARKEARVQADALRAGWFWVEG